jgi:hypothetical protein
MTGAAAVERSQQTKPLLSKLASTFATIVRNDVVAELHTVIAR